MKETRYITHLVSNELPEEGLRKLFFYTATAEGYNQGEYFWGSDNNSFNENYIKNLENLERIIRLPVPRELEDKKGLWVDKEGKVYYADLVNPFKDKKPIFAPKQFSRVSQIYHRDIGANNLPKLICFYEIPK